MKKFTLVVVFLAMTFGFMNQSMATKSVKVSQIISPTSGATINSGVPFNLAFCIQNSGDENLVATDSIYFMWGYWVGSTFYRLGNIYYVHMPHKVLAPLDTITIAWNGVSLTGGTGTLKLGIYASTSLTVTFAGTTVDVNFVSGISDVSKSINKVWYNNESLNLELNPKISCQANLYVTSLSGQVIASKIINMNADEMLNEQLSLGSLSKGIYILTIRTSYGSDTRKFIVQ